MAASPSRIAEQASLGRCCRVPLERRASLSTKGVCPPGAIPASPLSVVVTGAAGFIGAELCAALCSRGIRVLGIDRRDEGASDVLVCERLGRLRRFAQFTFLLADLRDAQAISSALEWYPGAPVVHLAAQAGVRHSQPEETVEFNVVATRTLLGVLRHQPPSHLIFASSSSVYGRATVLPFREDQTPGAPASLYAQTKAECESLVTAFARNTGVPSSTLRLFNVFGPRMRDDLAISVFARRIAAREPLSIADGGRVTRDMTYIDDVVRVISTLLTMPPLVPETLNVGTGRMVELSRVVDILESHMGARVERHSVSRSDFDLPATLADVARLSSRLGFKPDTSIEEGVAKFVSWFLNRANLTAA